MSEGDNILKGQSQKPTVGEIVSLYRIFVTDVDPTLPTLFITPTQFTNVALSYDGQQYTPVDIESDGWEANAQGAFPEPTIKLSLASAFDEVGTVASVIRSLIISNQGLVGARVQRIRTLGRFLDGQPDADPDAHYPIDEYRIEVVEQFNKFAVGWKLSAIIDQEGLKLPRRQVIKDYCSHTYRTPDDAAADTFGTNHSCPYASTGSGAYFDKKGNPVVLWTDDNCGRRISDCKLRFQKQTGKNNPDLPTRAFPGVSRTRVR